MSIFQKSVINKFLNNIDSSTATNSIGTNSIEKEKVSIAYKNFQKFYGNKKRLANIMQLKEENYQEGFLREIFVQTLGYTINPDENFNLTTEYKNQKDSRKADGAIIKDGKAIGVIELKSTKTKNLDSIKEQAFGYKNNQANCKYVITSNFHNLRFYIENATEYEEFDLFELGKTETYSEEFKKFYLLLSAESILNDLPEKIKQETKFHENEITKHLYSDYKHFKDKIFQNLVENNQQYDKLILFKKSQKLLDRFLFVFFAEDCGLIPPNTISKIIEQWKMFIEEDAYFTLYSLFQKLFSHIDKGHNYKKWGKIPAYNGGLFRYDEILDNKETIIDDDILEKDSIKLSSYDFNTEVDVNILGHIFEHSLNEIEEVSAEIEGEKPTAKKVSKRKKDGVFYTPKYITKYIVENTVGKLCDEKKQEMGINNLLIDEKYRKKDGKINEQGRELFDTLNSYKEWLLSLKILDPACGSGAFLNQTLVYLIDVHKEIDDLIMELEGKSDALRLYDTDKAVLENNIYGVDINEESIEIAKLSLWLRTAQKGRKLSDLSSNIKCGNSLIDDPEVAGDKAFVWEEEFKEIFDNGGFDVVIGNPPYVLCQPSNTEKEILDYYKTYEVASYKIDLFHLFFEKSIQILNNTGILGFITPNTYLTNKYIKPLRNFILKETAIDKIVNHKETVFEEAGVDVATIILDKKNSNDNEIKIFETDENSQNFTEINLKKQKDWIEGNDNIFNIQNNFTIDVTNTTPLISISSSYFGIQAYDRKSSISKVKENENYIPVIDGGDIFSYNYSKPTKYFNFIASNIKSGGNYNIYKEERIVIRQIGKTPIVGLCQSNIVTSNTLYNLNITNINYNLKYGGF